MSSAYLRLLIFLPAILIPAYASSNPVFLMMLNKQKLNKQGDNIQPWRTPFPVFRLGQSACSLHLFYVCHYHCLMSCTWQTTVLFFWCVRWENGPCYFILIMSRSPVQFALLFNLKHKYLTPIITVLWHHQELYSLNPSVSFISLILLQLFFYTGYNSFPHFYTISPLIHLLFCYLS